MKKIKLIKTLMIASVMTASLGITALASSGGSSVNICDTRVNYSYTYDDSYDHTAVASKTQWAGVSGKWVVSQVIKYNSGGTRVEGSYDYGAHWAYAKAAAYKCHSAWIQHSVQPYDRGSHIWDTSYTKYN